jgi:SNF2 family DNA or RNA helicase
LDCSSIVFKLIASGTIEERMLELQERKKRIAEGMYGQENALPAQLTAEDVEALFQPF